MNLKDILAKKPGDLTADEKAFLRQHWKELSEEQQTEFADAAPATDTENGGTSTEDEGKDEVDEGAVKALITEAITKKVDELSVTDKISAAATEVVKTLGEQRKAVSVIKT